MDSAPRLLHAPLVGLYPIELHEANAFLEAVAHKLGPCRRPFHSEAFGLEVDGTLTAVAISASIVNGPVAGFDRQQVVELARLGASVRWANRVMLRLWRETCARQWQGWPVLAAVSYSKNSTHSGDLYRFDGWTKVRDDSGSHGGGSWTRKRYATDAVFGSKSLWVYRYDGDT